jgi:hypothetical protein
VHEFGLNDSQSQVVDSLKVLPPNGKLGSFCQEAEQEVEHNEGYS